MPSPPTPTPDMVCGACRKYETSRTDAKYGYCGPRERLAEEQRNRNEYRSTGLLVDVATPCFMVRFDGSISKPAFEAKP